jgi:hypothetical protein
MTDRGCDASQTQLCILLGDAEESSFFSFLKKDKPALMDGRKLTDVMDEIDVMKNMSLTEALTQMRGDDMDLLTKDDLVNMFEPPSERAFELSEWGKQLNLWHATFLGINIFHSTSPPPDIPKYSKIIL